MATNDPGAISEATAEASPPGSLLSTIGTTLGTVGALATAGLAIGSLVNAVSGGGSGQLHDYTHASKLFVANSYALAPKHTFLFHVFFDTTMGGAEEGMLVKQCTLPKISYDTKTMNVYNRPYIIQTKVHYDPVQITLHDDSSDVIRQFLFNYYKYYFADPDGADFGYRGQDKPFLRAIRIYSLFNKKFSEYTLINPVIKNMSHPEHHVGQGGDVMQHTLTVEYETVLLSGGTSSPGTVNGFAELHYDNSQSSIPGSNSNSPMPKSVGGSNSMPVKKTQLYDKTSNPQEKPSGNSSLLSGVSSALDMANQAMGIASNTIGALANAKMGNLGGALAGAAGAIGQVDRLMGSLGASMPSSASVPMGQNIMAGNNPNSPIAIPSIGGLMTSIGDKAVGVASSIGAIGTKMFSSSGIPAPTPVGVASLPSSVSAYSNASSSSSSGEYSNMSPKMPSDLQAAVNAGSDSNVRSVVTSGSYSDGGVTVA
jgi:hypothetical protein